LCEVQGYVYAAYNARAHFAHEVGDDDTEQHFREKAARLRAAFNRDFWLPDRGYYALGLDRDKRPIDSLASNMGHCLWTGIIDPERAADVAHHLLSPEMFGGWGIRTLATSMAAYDPLSYHNGSVWPHDNALIAAGLMRYGFVEEAQRVILAMLDAGVDGDGRLPELFAGVAREEVATPVSYPTSCSPQAWAAATPLMFLRTLLRFDPWVPYGKLWCSPDLPPAIERLSVEGIPLDGHRVSVHVIDGRGELDAVPAHLELIREPRLPLAMDSDRRNSAGRA
jgi:glycogen debranching enzyme